MTVKVLTVGHACLDVVHYVPTMPTPDIKVPSDRLRVMLGGNAANVASALIELGADADLCCVLGSKYDPITNTILTLARSKNIGLDCCFIEHDSSPISSVMILPNGERALTSYQSQSIIDASCAIPDLDQYDMVHGDSYRLNLIRAAFSKAHAQRVPTMLDVDKPVDSISDLPTSNFTIFSKEAFDAMHLTVNDLMSLQKYFNGIVGYTAGPNAIVYADSQKIYTFQPKTIDNPVNTLGAGDSYRAALIMHLCYKKDIHTAIKLACNTAYEHILEKTLTTITGDIN